MDMVHMSSLLHCYETSQQYSARDFLRIARFQPAATSSCYHEFLLVHIGAARETLALIVERVPTNNGTQVISSSGGVARDTITVVRARENHEYWQKPGQGPVWRGTLRWDHPLPRLLDIAFISSAASTTFKYYNFYTRQCYWYARIILAAMAGAFPSCSREGTTSFSRRWLSVFGNYKPSQVQLLVDLHTIGCRDLCPPSGCLTPVASVIETDRHAGRSVAPDPVYKDLYCSWLRPNQKISLQIDMATEFQEKFLSLASRRMERIKRKTLLAVRRNLQDIKSCGEALQMSDYSVQTSAALDTLGTRDVNGGLGATHSPRITQARRRNFKEITNVGSGRPGRVPRLADRAKGSISDRLITFVQFINENIAMGCGCTSVDVARGYRDAGMLGRGEQVVDVAGKRNIASMCNSTAGRANERRDFDEVPITTRV
ncbi:hypothetical protein EDC04DRAFT_2605376 [Pisolithus marmoratus]|nr:hypothetical protein EDC04DRAFT_2605376 [Pisolithus marmoratus]